jgi:hypothetical protein
MNLSRKWILTLVWCLTAIAILPVVFQWRVPDPVTGLAAQLIVGSRYLLGMGICYWIYRSERKRLARAQAVALAYVIFVLTVVVNMVHYITVDRASMFPDMSNLQWQMMVQNAVIQLQPGVLPHSYRFLPNCLVRWMELGGIRFDVARDIYRMIVGPPLFYAMYRYARLFTNYAGAILAMVLVAVVFPVSYAQYAGQLTDPMSHLSFLLAFLFLETGPFGLLLTTLLIGSLAKETVLALAGYYVLFRRDDSNYRLKSVVLCVSSTIAYYGIRLLVLKGPMHYRQISSDVTLEHIRANWLLPGFYPHWVPLWVPLLACTVGIFLPFLVVGWHDTPRSLRSMALFLLPVLFISGLLWTWLHEARNFMPLVFVLAVAASRYIMGVASRSHEGVTEGNTIDPVCR